MPGKEFPEIRVGVCEDDEDLRDIFIQSLTYSKIKAFGIPSAEALTYFLNQTALDVLLLDIGLPGEDGYSVARRVREAYPALGIIMVTARGSVDDRVRGLSGGADVYFVKPVDLEELKASICSLHRRLAPTSPKGDPLGPWRLDRLQATLQTPSGSRIPLAESECRVLAELLICPGVTVSKERLLASLGWDSKHRLEAMISRLRRKASQPESTNPLPIRARHGDGYAFLAPATVI